MGGETKTKVGIAVYCATCGLRKKPIGRDAPMAMATSLCDHECSGYRQNPRPGGLWPGEKEVDFGYPVGSDGVEEVPSDK